jgi:hypothetical protein
MAEQSRLVTNLPASPDNSLDTELYNQLQVIYRSIQNLVRTAGRLTGIDPIDSSEWASTPPGATLLLSSATRFYVPAMVVIPRGSAVALVNDAGTLKAALATANNVGTLPAIGIANSSAAAAGDVIEINWLRGFINSVSGLTTGTTYYLAIRPGGIVNAQPTGAGTISQPIGVAFSPTTMAMDISLSYRINP